MNRTESTPERKEVSTRLSALVILLAVVACGAVAWYFLYWSIENEVANTPAGLPIGPAARTTTIQTASLDVGKTQNALQLQYLDLPFGPVTFGHMEKGDDSYYSKRTWPFAHLKLAVNAKYEGKDLVPGDYVLVFTPKGLEPEMAIALASFNPDPPGSTFLVPGSVSAETPKDAVVVHKKPITFGTGAPVEKALHFDLAKVDGGAEIRLHYGDRTLTERLTIPQ
jgi:hypothetical protein